MFFIYIFMKFLEKIKLVFSELVDDLKNKRITKKVKFLCVAICLLVVVIALVCFICVKKANINTASNTSPLNDASTEADILNSESIDNSDSNPDDSEKVDDKASNEEKAKEEELTVLLAESPDAGELYIDETLFVGDSNTVRMMNYGITSVDNTIAVVGMGIQSVKSLKCIQFDGYSEPVTMVEAVKLMQPRRIIITFGTNNANGMSTVDFVTKYKEALDAIHEAYPYADVLINTIPPICQKNSYPKLSQKSIDDFNKALYDLAEAMDLKLLDTASVMKDEKTGYAREGFTVGDGIHLSDTGFAAMFTYIRTHSLKAGDSRPKKLAEIPKQIKETYVIDSNGKMNNDPDAYSKMSEVTKAEKEALKKAQEEALKKAQEEILNALTAEQNTKQEDIETVLIDKNTCKHENYNTIIVREATENEKGLKRYVCLRCGYVYEETIPEKENLEKKREEEERIRREEEEKRKAEEEAERKRQEQERIALEEAEKKRQEEEARNQEAEKKRLEEEARLAEEARQAEEEQRAKEEQRQQEEQASQEETSQSQSESQEGQEQGE